MRPFVGRGSGLFRAEPTTRSAIGMAEPLFIFCYDISRRRPRTRVADLLEKTCIRVQRSVFEGRMASRNARKIAHRAARYLEPGDSLRMYAVTSDGLERSLAFGPLPLPEAQDFYLL